MPTPMPEPSEAEAIRFDTRLLFLSTTASQVERSLRGERLDLAEARPLRDDISTDEITPLPILTHCDDRLGRHPCTGFRAGEQFPIATDAIRRSGIEVVVAGRRYGKGSSREHSPTAEKAAGVRLVVAESFERLYRQNADNIGLFTSTDFGLIPRIQAGEAIALGDLVAGRDALAAAILRSGGLLRFGQRFMRDITRPGDVRDARPRTLFEKIVARHAPATELTDAHPAPGDGAFVRADLRFVHEYYTGMAAHMLHATFGRPLHLHESGSIVVFEDHTSYVAESPAHVRGGLVPNVHRMVEAQRDFAAAYGLRTHRTLTEDEAALDDGTNVAGISHAMVAEHYALPGQLVVGTDSHTTHSGALGCVAFGVGTTDMANAFVTGAVRLTVPESLRIVLAGTLAPGVTAEDVVLHLLALPFVREGGGVGRVFEFTGDVVSRMSIDERATLTNMTAELGGFTGIVAPDAQTVRFLHERRGVDFAVAPWMRSDPDAVYARTIRVDCSQVPPIVAAPGDPGNGLRLTDVAGPVRIDIAYGGSCTAGKRDDFDRVGARILQPSCGACGNCGPGGSLSAEQVTVSAINRNFPGRGGPGQVWLARPPTVAASAVAGELLSSDELRARHASASRQKDRALPSPPASALADRSDAGSTS